jgi:hypothetical protein
MDFGDRWNCPVKESERPPRKAVDKEGDCAIWHTYSHLGRDNDTQLSRNGDPQVKDAEGGHR